MRVDVMTKMRNVDSFSKLWLRRTTISIDPNETCELMSLADLVQAKKTQRDKDWPMIRRLVEVHYFANRESANPGQRRFWFMELRTPELLIELASVHPNVLRRFKRKRPLLELAQMGNESALADAILQEERAERAADRQYWAPLKRELEQLHLTRKKPSETR